MHYYFDSAHHAHSFSKLDPLRPLSNLLLPEGFPAHPHAGFDTVTYCIDGGLKHRDSEGVKMAYGDGEVQWMRAGKGIIHEEMWDVSDDNKRIEIFQLWVNLAARSKGKPAEVKVIKSSDIPVVKFKDQGVSCKVICGSVSYETNNSEGNIDKSEECDLVTIEGPGNSISDSSIGIMHVNMQNKLAEFNFESATDSSVVVYIRRGSLILEDSVNGMDVGSSLKSDNQPTRREIFPGDMVIYKSRDSRRNGVQELSSVNLKPGDNGLDCLILIGEPLKEPVVMGGPFVASSEEEYYRQARAFERVGRNAFWDFKLADKDWLEHCAKLSLKELLTAER